MKSCVAFVAVFFFLKISFGQTNLYHSFKVGTQWSVLNEYFEYANPTGGDSSKALYKFYGLGDSTIAGKVYLKIKYDGFVGEPIFLIRDDSIDRKVYFRNGVDDILLYDFSVSIGDNISFTYAFANNSDAYVDRIDSVLIGEDYRKMFTVRYLNQYFNPDIADFQDSLISTFLIEGIGSEYGPLLNSAFDNGYLMNNTYKVLCYFENGEQLYSEISEYADCDSTFYDYSVEIQNNNQAFPDFIIYPNPSSGEFVITLGNSLFNFDQKKLSVFIESITGEKYQQYFTTLNDQIDVSELPEGLYFVKIISDNNQQIIKQLVKI